MTCVAGVIGPRGEIWMGADSGWTDNDNLSQNSLAQEKVFRVGEFMIGACGSYRGSQLVRYAFEPPKKTSRTPIDRYMVTSFIDALRATWKNGGHLFKSKSDDEPSAESVGTQLLIGHKGMLWVVEEDLQIARLRDEYAAIGSGIDIALGSLYSTRKHPPKERVLTALRAAERYNAAVRGPFIVLPPE